MDDVCVRVSVFVTVCLLTSYETCVLLHSHSVR